MKLMMAILGLAFLVLGTRVRTTSAASVVTQRAITQTTTLLVDTDDSCRLTVDDQDEGVITPAQAKKIKVSLGDHIVKCVVEKIPDLMWRKAVQAKSSEQAVAIVALKALHIQYDQAVGKAQQQQVQAAGNAQAAVTAEEKRKATQHALLQLRSGLIGTWQSVYKQAEPPSNSGKRCQEQGWSVNTVTLTVYEGLGSAPDVLTTKYSTTYHSHYINYNTCKFGNDHDFDNFQAGTIKVMLDQPSVIDSIYQTEDDDGRPTGTAHSRGEISFINANRILIAWEQAENVELDRVP